MNIRGMALRKVLAFHTFILCAVVVLVALIRWAPLPDGLLSLLSVMIATFGGGYLATSTTEAVKGCSQKEPS
jgi:hypothetical protein